MTNAKEWRAVSDVPLGEFRYSRSLPSLVHVFKFVCLFNTEENDLPAVHRAVSSVSDKFVTLATQLGLPPCTVCRVEKECTTINECLRQILLEWLRRNYETKRHGLPSWRLLCAAVASEAGGCDKRLASEIADKHHISVVSTVQTGTVLYLH